MNIVIPTAEGKLQDAQAVAKIDKLQKLKREHQTDIWPVIDYILQIWQESKPNEWRSIILDIEDTRKSKYSKTGRSVNERGVKGDLRRTLDIPVFVDRAIRFTYSVDELPYNKEFFTEMWKRYPAFRVSDVL